MLLGRKKILVILTKGHLLQQKCYNSQWIREQTRFPHSQAFFCLYSMVLRNRVLGLQSDKRKLLSRVQLFVTPWTDYTVHGILQLRILEWVAFPFSRGSSQPRDWAQVSCTAGGFFTSWATREALLASRDLVLNQWSHICNICPLWLRPLSLSRQILYFLQNISLPL